MTTSVTESTVTEDNPLVFRALDYCDACSSAAGKYRVWVDRWKEVVENDTTSFKSLDLILCSHHFSKHFAAIEAAGYESEEL